MIMDRKQELRNTDKANIEHKMKDDENPKPELIKEEEDISETTEKLKVVCKSMTTKLIKYGKTGIK